VVLFGTGLLGEKGRHALHGKQKEPFERLDMTTKECTAVFPGLTKEIEDAVSIGPFELTRKPNYTTGMVQGRIEDGKVRSWNLQVVLSLVIFLLGHIRC
jgi:hypothetical protein